MVIVPSFIEALGFPRLRPIAGTPGNAARASSLTNAPPPTRACIPIPQPIRFNAGSAGNAHANRDKVMLVSPMWPTRRGASFLEPRTPTYMRILLLHSSRAHACGVRKSWLLVQAVYADRPTQRAKWRL